MKHYRIGLSTVGWFLMLLLGFTVPVSAGNPPDPCTDGTFDCYSISGPALVGKITVSPYSDSYGNRSYILFEGKCKNGKSITYGGANQNPLNYFSDPSIFDGLFLGYYGYNEDCSPSQSAGGDLRINTITQFNYISDVKAEAQVVLLWFIQKK